MGCDRMIPHSLQLLIGLAKQSITATRRLDTDIKSPSDANLKGTRKTIHCNYTTKEKKMNVQDIVKRNEKWIIEYIEDIKHYKQKIEECRESIAELIKQNNDLSE